MIKKKFLFLLTVTLIIFTGTYIFAGKCPNVKGDWDFNYKGVVYTPGSGNSFETDYAVIYITDQEGCFFAGDVEGPNVNCALIGSIKNKKITATMCGTIVRGNLLKNNRKMKLIIEDIALDRNDIQSVWQGIAVKR